MPDQGSLQSFECIFRRLLHFTTRLLLASYMLGTFFACFYYRHRGNLYTTAARALVEEFPQLGDSNGTEYVSPEIVFLINAFP